MPDAPILPYELRPARFVEWDARAPLVARRVAALVSRVRPGAVVEHVGSTAVRGLPGKGYVDLGIVVDPDEIPGLVAEAHALGFQPQPGIAPWPPTRPMLVGAVDEDGERLNVHLHLIPPARGELEELVAFRDALRVDASLRDAYAATKRAIVDSASTPDEKLLYTVRKGDFVEEALYRLGIRRGPADPVEPLPPGATIGVLGGGQLGRMLGLAARAMGYRIVVLDPDPACPAAVVADEVVAGAYDDPEAALRLAERSDVVTYELEHVGSPAVAGIAGRVPVRPGLRALEVTQDRLAERRFLRDTGEWTAPWREVRGEAEAVAAAEALGYPLRLKVPIGGYDGRSQARVAERGAIATALRALGGEAGRPLLMEREIEFEAELSVVVARGRDGRSLAFPVARNRHDAGILVESVAPAPVPALRAADAREIGVAISRLLDLVGLVTVELFALPGTGMMVNELAPRVHNSGHWTIEGAATSQFEQHVRAICGLPLGSAEPRGAAAVVNVLGVGPDRLARLAGLEAALEDPGAHVHVYGKRHVFERRKMGHVTVVANDPDEALGRARTAAAALRWED